MPLRLPALPAGLRRAAPPLVAALLVLVPLVAVTAGGGSPGGFRLRNAAFDALQRAFPRADADRIAPGTGVVVVDIDEASLAREGQWPWPRRRMARLIRNLQDAGAAAIGLDFVFPEPDRSSPATLAPAWARDEGIGVAAPGGGALPDYDRDMAEAIGRGRVVTGYGLVPTPGGRLPEVANGVTLAGAGTLAELVDFAGAVANLPAFDAAAAGQGNFSLVKSAQRDDGDGFDEVVRRLPLFAKLRGVAVPSLAAEVLRVAQGEDAELALRSEHAGGLLGGTTSYTARIGDRFVPVDLDAGQWLRFGPRDPARRVPATAVLDGDAGPLGRAVGGRIVLVGTSALGLADLRPTPLNAFEPGVAIHAAALEQILAGDVLTRPSSARLIEAWAAAAAGLLIAGAVAWRGAVPGALAMAGAGAGAAGAAALLFARFDLLFDPGPVVLCAAASYGTALAARHLVSERRARHLRTAFGQYLSPQLVDALARDPDRLKLGGEERTMTFLFTDLEGFTAFTEAVSPALLVSTLNRYLDGVCALVLDHGGTIDKIVGDAVHVMFNAPLDQPDHAARAVRCALAIDAFAEGFARAAVAEAAIGRAFGTTRIGVNTGRAVVGNFGGARRFDYTAHGDAINTAARLEAANKRLGTRICVSRATVEAMDGGAGLRFRPIGALGLKGKAVRVDVFAPVAAGAPEGGWADRYGDAFAKLSRGEADGPDAILALLGQFPDDPLLRFHADRIARGLGGTDVALQAA